MSAPHKQPGVAESFVRAHGKLTLLIIRDILLELQDHFHLELNYGPVSEVWHALNRIDPWHKSETM